MVHSGKSSWSQKRHFPKGSVLQGLPWATLGSRSNHVGFDAGIRFLGKMVLGSNLRGRFLSQDFFKIPMIGESFTRTNCSRSPARRRHRTHRIRRSPHRSTGWRRPPRGIPHSTTGTPPHSRSRLLGSRRRRRNTRLRSKVRRRRTGCFMKRFPLSSYPELIF